MKKIAMLVAVLSLDMYCQLHVSEHTALAGNCSTAQLMNPKLIDAEVNDAGYSYRVYETRDHTRIECIGNAGSLYALYISGYGQPPSFAAQDLFCNIKLDVMNMTNLMTENESWVTQTYMDHNREIRVMKNPSSWMIIITGKE